MSQLNETPAFPPSPSFDIPSPTGDPPAGPSIERRASRLDHVFNFQIVVFEVENTLFQVLRNGFNVPGTPFEAMFALPQTQSDSIEGSSLENPIYLPGIKVDHFRSFLRILYPFIDQKPVVDFDEWVGVLNLANMWLFQDIRARAVSKLSELIKQKKVMERIALARKYRVEQWLRDAYLELTEKAALDFEELRPAEPFSNGEFNPLDRNWEETSRDWETLARIFYLRAKVATSVISTVTSQYSCRCFQCGGTYSDTCLCATGDHLPRSKLPVSYAMVDEIFRGELKSFKENPGDVEIPLPPNSTDSAKEKEKR